MQQVGAPLRVSPGTLKALRAVSVALSLWITLTSRWNYWTWGNQGHPWSLTHPTEAPGILPLAHVPGESWPPSVPGQTEYAQWLLTSNYHELIQMVID